MTLPPRPPAAPSAAGDGSATDAPDARLLAALRHAPDAQLEASADLGEALRFAARSAVAASAEAAAKSSVAAPSRRWSWLDKWLQPGPAAGLALVVMASVVVGLWMGEDVPPAARPEPVPVSPAPATAVVAAQDKLLLGAAEGEASSKAVEPAPAHPPPERAAPAPKAAADAPPPRAESAARRRDADRPAPADDAAPVATAPPADRVAAPPPAPAAAPVQVPAPAVTAAPMAAAEQIAAPPAVADTSALLERKSTISEGRTTTNRAQAAAPPARMASGPAVAELLAAITATPAQDLSTRSLAGRVARDWEWTPPGQSAPAVAAGETAAAWLARLRSAAQGRWRTADGSTPAAIDTSAELTQITFVRDGQAPVRITLFAKAVEWRDAGGAWRAELPEDAVAGLRR